ncbi:MAG: methylmalonyl-CoA mutase family protein [Deltaproteobacteria bacterium]|jgi:methylmalonyl-CoA mutase N-terminal domain/subunit|nr:methylmalonyl-CoA mutase family protein [Deltaproteobacteria bacterium]
MPKNRKDSFKTSSGIEPKAFYSANDWPPKGQTAESLLGEPGDFPYTRGVQSTMYRGRLWTMRQYAGFGSAKESNTRYKMLLDRGQTGLSVAFDLPTQMGYDSDHVMSTGEVGKVGVAISSIEDMEVLLKDLPLEKISTSMTINSTAGILLALYIAVAKRRGISADKLTGTIQNDLLKEYIARGTYIFPPRPSLRLITDIFDYCAKEVPNWNTISISGYHIREAGSTAAQEIAFTLANGITYVEAAIEKGLDIDSFAGRLSFFFNVHNNFLEEVAKFRAARRMWAKIMRDRFKAKDDKSWRLRFHSQTAGSTLTAQQPENNIVRVTIQALASVLGGTQSLHTNSMDEALGLPTEKAATIALRTQQIVAHESGAADVIDPFAGSYYVENLTDELEAKATDYITRIEGLGGVVKCIETGWIQREIQQAAYDYQRAVESKREIVVGVNEFVQNTNISPEIMKISESVSNEQIVRLKAFKAKRNQSAVNENLARIKTAAGTDKNLMPLFVEAVEAGCTLGEISDSLRGVFGFYKETITV